MTRPLFARVRRLRLGDASAVAVATVWLTHGLVIKLLGASPRHLAIVQSVPGLAGHTGEWVLLAVGAAEVAIAAWVLFDWAPRLCASLQTTALLSMNVLELTFARDLLLWPAALLPVNAGFIAVAWTAASGPRRFRLRNWLRRHPLAVNARLENCLTLIYALPAEVLRRLVPPGLELETKDGLGFLAVALVQTRSLRPSGLPPRCGQDFVLAGYRIFTTFRTAQGRRLRGLKILRSDADRARMVAAGNLLTHYNYHRCAARIEASADRLAADVRSADGHADLTLVADLNTEGLPDGSPFGSIREARRFAGPLPFTFDYEPETDAIIVIKATRARWTPKAVAVRVEQITFLDQPAFVGVVPRLAAAFHVHGVDYCWDSGVRYAIGEESRVQ